MSVYLRPRRNTHEFIPGWSNSLSARPGSHEPSPLAIRHLRRDSWDVFILPISRYFFGSFTLRSYAVGVPPKVSVNHLFALDQTRLLIVTAFYRSLPLNHQPTHSLIVEVQLVSTSNSASR